MPNKGKTRWKDDPSLTESQMNAASSNPVRQSVGSPYCENNDLSESIQPEAQDSQKKKRLVTNLVMANSWIVSLIVHLGLLIFLSILSYSLHQGAELEIQLAHSPADDPTFMIEADDSQSNDGKNLDSEMEQLLAASSESAVFEINAEPIDFDPQVSLERMDGSDNTSSEAEAGVLASDRKIGNGKQAEFFGIQASGENFVFIVDSSGSMSGPRWKNAIRELRNSLGSLENNQQFYVIFFDHQTHLMFQGRVDRFRKSRKLKMINANEKNLAKVNNWLRRVNLGNQTRPRVSFDYGLTLEPDAIFFLTDGEFQDGTYEYLMSIAASDSQLPTIHTVAFGNPIAGRTLEAIAERFAGKYRFVR